MKLVYIVVALVGAFVVYTMVANKKSTSNTIAAGAVTSNPTGGSQSETPSQSFASIADGIAKLMGAGNQVAQTWVDRND
jgi:hypothetical protein